MPEIKTPPVKLTNPLNSEEYDCFGPEHTLADISRWILQNTVNAETIRDLLNEGLAK